MPSNSRKHRNASAPERVRSARADTFARLRDDSGLPNGGVGASVGDQMYFRTLLIAILAVCAALFAGVAAAGADDPAPGAPPVADQALCVAVDGTVHVAPAGTPAGEPLACPEGYPPPAAPAAQPDPAATPAEQPAPAPAAEQPAPAPVAEQPAATDPKTEAPGSAKVEPQKIEKGDGIENPQAEVKVVPKAGSHEKADADAKSKDADKDKSDADNGGVAGPAVDDYPLVLAPPLPARSIPNILLDRFQIPPFLLPLYQAAGVQYGVRWEILAAINSIETDYGRNLSVSTAGAVGWMQFMPSTWEMYGVDANGDGRKDPYNPVDAIFAAARYLKAAGAGDSLRRAIFAYNHADWYVNDVLGRASAISELPDEVVASLSGLTLGRFPSPGAPLRGPREHQGRSHHGPQRLASDRGRRQPPRHAHLHAGRRPGRRRPGRRRRRHRRDRAPRQVRAPARRLRQPLRLRPPRHDRRQASRPARAPRQRQGDPPRARPRSQGQEAEEGCHRRASP